MEYEHLEVATQQHIKIVSFNRADKGNSLTLSSMKELIHLCESLHEDTETRVVIFSGKGKNFCTGADLTDPDMAKQQQESLLTKMRSLEIGPKMISTIYNLPQITIAALQGKTLGGGACIASACDFRVATESSQIGYPESNLAMNLSWLGLPLCVHLVGPSKAKRLVILGNRESAIDLLDWGFIDELTLDDSLMVRATEMAEAYAKQPPVAAQMIKRSVNRLVSALDESIMHMDKDQFILTTGTKDFMEGVTASMQRREAKFTGE